MEIIKKVETIEEILTPTALEIYESLKLLDEVTIKYLGNSLKKIINNTFIYDFDILPDCDYKFEARQRYEIPENYSLYGVCSHGATFSKLIVNSLVPSIKTCEVSTLADENEKMHHILLGMLSNENFYLFSAVSSAYKFGLIENDEMLSQVGKIKKIDLKPVTKFRKIIYDFNEIIPIKYCQKNVEVFHSERKKFIKPLFL